MMYMMYDGYRLSLSQYSRLLEGARGTRVQSVLTPVPKSRFTPGRYASCGTGLSIEPPQIHQILLMM